MSNFLDKTGLSYFWQKVKAYITNNTTPKLTGGAGKFIGFTEDNVVGIIRPNRMVVIVATYDGTGTVSGNSNTYHLYSITESGLGSTEQELNGLLFRVYFPVASNGTSTRYALRVNGGSYRPVRVFSGYYGTIRDSLPLTGMINGQTVPLAMFIRSKYSEGDNYYAQFMIQNYTVPYGSSVVANAWGIGAGGTGATTASAARTNLGAARTPGRIGMYLNNTSWGSDNTLTVYASGVTDDEEAQLIQIVPRLDCLDAYMEAGVVCIGQSSESNGKLTFRCDTIPTIPLYVYAIVQPIEQYWDVED